ncbi:hypothetical protein [Kitasatospora camelliae]|uniref:Uncharacterized protein n=1 Tax=Kitasatospora camelliae TaxID=3156397 RepID=A0AAU8K5M5_9ACTN
MHFTLVVALPPAARDDVRAALAAALAPFDIEREVEAYPEYETAAAPADTLWVQYARRRGELPDRDDLTWAQVTETVNLVRGYRPGTPNHLAVDEAGRAYRLSTFNRQGKWDGYQVGGQWEAHFLHRPEATGDPRLITVRRGHPDEDGPDGVPACDGGPRALLDFEALRARAVRPAGPEAPAPSTDQDVARARDEAVPGDALLRLDGTWLEPGTGVTDSWDAYLRAANAYLDGLDGDVLLVAVHCHG